MDLFLTERPESSSGKITRESTHRIYCERVSGLKCIKLGWLNGRLIRPVSTPIEHAWSLLKHKQMNYYPHIQGESQLDWTEFRALICTTWDEFDQEVVDSLVSFMPRHLDAFIKARIYYTNTESALSPV